ncbi:hypothetical protein RhiirA4_452321 [Rhizophagus irregularis]|uniref:Uncharacterized protein n=1 Tax=Rhizophagus irregularis TaxID=588596 RepID=A0A2I1FXR0_9GLOM|nr:hypothetical protein RhiirA4_452321 [Rhizophagus irregularis]
MILYKRLNKSNKFYIEKYQKFIIILIYLYGIWDWDLGYGIWDLEIWDWNGIWDLGWDLGGMGLGFGTNGISIPLIWAASIISESFRMSYTFSILNRAVTVMWSFDVKYCK